MLFWMFQVTTDELIKFYKSNSEASEKFGAAFISIFVLNMWKLVFEFTVFLSILFGVNR